VTIPKRILYIDSEGWFITASDQYDLEGRLWKTVATFNTYRDRTNSRCKNGDLSVQAHAPGGVGRRKYPEQLLLGNLHAGTPEQRHSECWCIDLEIVTMEFLDPHKGVVTSH